MPSRCGVPWLGFIVYPTHRLGQALDLYQSGQISFAELDASVQGWINHVHYADTWGLREHMFATHPIPRRAGP